MAAAPQDQTARVTLEAWLVTDVGVVREHNEDSAFMDPSTGVFIVADGMGGHAAGEVASAMAVNTVRKTLEGARAEIEGFRKAPSDAGRRAMVQLLQNAVLAAHNAVFQRGQDEPDKAGMGTTLDVVLITGPEAFVAHVGDSRTYLVRDRKTSQLTTDHTVAEVWVIEGKLTIEEAQVSPMRNVLVNALGVGPDVGVEMAHVMLRRGDRLLLCSDGLHEYFASEDQLAQQLSADETGKALGELVELAKAGGGHDNITGIAIEVTELVHAAASPLEVDSTQPVELQGKEFTNDEPTQIALAQPAATRREANKAKARAKAKAERAERGADDRYAHADTVPPLDATVPVSTEATPPPAEPTSPAAVPAAPRDAGDGAKASPDAKASTGTDAGNGATASPDAKASSGTAAGAAAGAADGVPTEVATADTGRTVAADDKTPD